MPDSVLREADQKNVFVAVGGNLGDRNAHLVAARNSLESHPEVSILQLSPVYETDAVGPGEQPAYLNAVMRLETTLAPQVLLLELQRIELSRGRDRGPDAIRWGARELDLDLVFYGTLDLETETLRVPHPRAHERGFVMRPLADLAPDWIHPLLGRSMASLWSGLREATAGTLRPWPDPPGWRSTD